MDFKDYYKILGVQKTASADEIKKSYRKLAVKYHPDKNQNNKAAEDKFKEVNEANSVLGDVEKRKKYDELGQDWANYQQAGGTQGFDGFKQGNQQGARASQYSSQQFDDDDFADFFSTIFGGANQRTQAFKGQDYEANIHITLEEAYTGTTRQLELENEKLKLKIKPGTQDKQRLKIKGKGGKGMNKGPNGDLYLTIQVADHGHYQRKGDDLYCKIDVDLYTALLGGQTIVGTLRNPVKMTINKETDNGKRLIMKGMGMPRYDKENEFGDLYATVNITMPKNLSSQEIELFTQLSLLKNTPNAENI